LFVLTVTTQSVPWIEDAERLSVAKVGPNFWRAVARYGFMERPNIPALLTSARKLGCPLPLNDVTYYVGHETVVPREERRGLAAWETSLFIAMERNSVHVTDFFRLPSEGVVEIGRQIAI
jgi:KUP system potassium uptake protein